MKCTVEKKEPYYGRYVDDFVLIHEDKEYLKECIQKIRFFLSNNLKLNLHPKKIYLQHYSKGIKFLGAYIKSYRVYIGNRTKGNFYNKIQEINQIILKDKAQLQDTQAQKNILSKINSYLGLIRYYNTFKLRKKLLFSLNAYIWNYFYISEKYKVLTMKIRKVLNRKK